MNMRTVQGSVVCATLGIIGAAVCGVQQPQPSSKPMPPAGTTATPPPPPPKAAPSPTAKALEVLKVDAGDWDADISFWFRPDAPPTKSHASLAAKMDLAGMFLEQRFEGKFGPEMGNKPWTSLSYTGFNATTGQYEATRMASSHSTMIVVRGKAKPDGTIEMAGEYQFMGGKATERDVIRHDGPDKCTIETWMSFGDVPEFKGAEMVLTRVIKPNAGDANMRLGNFSLSLAVKDLSASKEFYEKLGFKSFTGNGKNWLIMQNDTSTIGLFQGMFEKNTMTFNPGWDRAAATLPEFDDVRDIQKMLKSKGITPTPAADETTTGPASLMIVDPDGNPILLDQHVASPRK